MDCAWEQQSDLNKQNIPEPSPTLIETECYINNKIESPLHEVMGTKETDVKDKPLSASETDAQSTLL